MAQNPIKPEHDAKFAEYLARRRAYGFTALDRLTWESWEQGIPLPELRRQLQEWGDSQ